MHPQRILPRSLAAIFFVLILAASALAQQYRILHADYGWGDQRVDVTERLRELARHDVTFRMKNHTFGVDPAPGREKVLRIFVREPGGGTRTLEYREGSVIDGSMFSGWRGGDWGDRDRDRDHDRDHDRDNDRDNDRDRRDRPHFGEVMEFDFGGGSGGRPAPDARCEIGFVAVAFHVQIGQFFNQAWLDCARMRPDGTLGDELRTTDRTGSPGGRDIQDAQCRPGHVLRGLRGRTGGSIDEAIGVCSELDELGRDHDRRRMDMTNPVTIPQPGGHPAEALCPPGAALVGFRSRSGAWMDHLSILCSELPRR